MSRRSVERNRDLDYEEAKFLVRAEGEGLVVVSFAGGTKQLWAMSTARKDASCILCNKGLPKGEKRFLPITNYHNRYHRICVMCMRDRSTS